MNEEQKPMKAGIRELVVSVLFLVIIVVMGIGTAVNVKGMYQKGTEKNPIVMFQNYSDIFSSNAVWKDEISKWNSELSMFLSGGTYLQSSQVLMGKEDWLFYKVENDGKPIEDYKGSNIYSQQELEQIRNNLIVQENYLKERGIRLIVEFLPNKETVYSEYLPDNVYAISDTKKQDLLVEYLQENTDLEIVYAKEDMLQSKEKMQLYYKYDTHWNLAGAFIGVQNLLKQINGTYYSVEPEYFDLEENKNEVYIRDLARISNMDSYFGGDNYYGFRKDAVDHGQWVDGNILIVGDSFSEYLKYMLQDNYCPKVDYVSILEFNPETLGTEYTPQIIVLECVERYTDRLKTVSFIPGIVYQ